VYSVLGERVIPGDGFPVCCCDKRDCRPSSSILSGLFLKVCVERFNSAEKSRSVVLITERLDCELKLLFLF